MKGVQTHKAGKAKIVPISAPPVGAAKKQKTSPGKAGEATSFDIPPRITHEMISQRAKAIWVSKGRPSGQDEQNWRQAEMELRMEQNKAIGK